MTHASDQPVTYHIRIKGRLEPRWESWFEGMTLTPGPNGETLLTGPIVDQAALHGILHRIRDLGLSLISIMQADSEPQGRPDGITDTGSSKETNP